MSGSGYIIPIGPPPSADIDLDLIFQAMVRGLTGLPGDLVRPRWQPNPPTQPGLDVNWVGLSVINETPDLYGFLQTKEVAPDEFQFIMHRHWSIDVLSSFYGPAAGGYATRMQTGLLIPQNLDALRQSADIAFQETGQQIIAPELIGHQWYRRVDVHAIFRHQRSIPYEGSTFLTAEAPILL